ncbi:hypothetical protein AMETH_2258 [Amycolatopsis methanolica 239]|uniref:NmrA family protein n=1 Tax=Amycolatopsis methanolica 239 TaxID=1068978 RepID=A0A076MUH0_AMYME|nr:hypothetical protein AMETH_2258 [Amycolatopsis methanolica 239]
MLGRVLGRDLHAVGLSDEETRAEMAAAMPADYVEAFARFYAEGRLDEATVHPDVAEVTGRPPRTFEQWARENADAFR